MAIYRDKYTDFNFNGVSSKDMKVWITNKNDLKHNITPTFSDSFTSPSFGGAQYLTGTNITKSDLTLNCAAININKSEWRAITRWLSPLAIGKLTLGYSNHYHYNVKVSSSISSELWVYQNHGETLGESYNVTFTVNFTTVGDWAANSDPVIVALEIDNDYVQKPYEKANNPFLTPNYLTLNKYNVVGYRETNNNIDGPFALRNGNLLKQEGDPLFVKDRGERDWIFNLHGLGAEKIQISSVKGAIEGMQSLTATKAALGSYYTYIEGEGELLKSDNSQFKTTVNEKYFLMANEYKNSGGHDSLVLWIDLYKSGVPIHSYGNIISDKCFFSFITDGEYTIRTRIEDIGEEGEKVSYKHILFISEPHTSLPTNFTLNNIEEAADIIVPGTFYETVSNGSVNVVVNVLENNALNNVVFDIEGASEDTYFTFVDEDNIPVQFSKIGYNTLESRGYLGLIIDFENIADFYTIDEKGIENYTDGSPLPLSAVGEVNFTSEMDFGGIEDYSIFESDVLGEGTSTDYNFLFFPVSDCYYLYQPYYEGLLFNTGAYNMYPDFFLTGEEVAIDFQENTHYKYKFSFGDGALEIQGRNGYALYNGNMIENSLLNIHGAGTSVVYSAETENLGPIPVESGEPELHSGRVRAYYSPLLKYKDEELDSKMMLIKFKKDNQNYLPRNKEFSITLIKRNVNVEAEKGYGEGEYAASHVSEVYDGQEYFIASSINAMINEDAENISFLIPKTDIEGYIDIKTGDYLYYAICTGEKVSVKSDIASITIVTRDLI